MSYVLRYGSSNFASTATVDGMKIYGNDVALLAAINDLASKYNAVPMVKSSYIGAVDNDHDGGVADNDVLLDTIVTPANGQLSIVGVSMMCTANPPASAVTVALDKWNGSGWDEVEIWAGTLVANQAIGLSGGSTVALTASSIYRLTGDFPITASGVDATEGIILAYNGYSGFASTV